MHNSNLLEFWNSNDFSFYFKLACTVAKLPYNPYTATLISTLSLYLHSNFCGKKIFLFVVFFWRVLHSTFIFCYWKYKIQNWQKNPKHKQIFLCKIVKFCVQVMHTFVFVHCMISLHNPGTCQLVLYISRL